MDAAGVQGKSFVIDGLVDLAYLDEESALIGKGNEMRATAHAKVDRIMPDFNNYTYIGCNQYIAVENRHCRKEVGCKRGLFCDEDVVCRHSNPCMVKNSEHFWRFKLVLADNYRRLEPLIWQAASDLLGKPEFPFSATKFRGLSPFNQKQILDSVLDHWFYFDLLYKHSFEQGFGEWTILRVKTTRSTLTLTSGPNMSGASEVADHPLQPVLISPSTPHVQFPIATADTLVDSLGHRLAIIKLDSGVVRGSPSHIEGNDNCRRTRHPTNTWRSAIDSIKSAIQGVEDVKLKLVKDLRALEAKSFGED